MTYFFIILLAISIIFFIAISSFEIANKLFNIYWLLFFGLSIYKIVIEVLNPSSLLIKPYIKKYRNIFANRYFIFSLCLVMILLSGLNETYYLGGDDTRLFYVYPELYLKNLATKIVSDSALSDQVNFLPANSISIFVVILVILKQMVGSLNLQHMLYTTNFILGFYFIYLLQDYLITLKSDYKKPVILATSFMYVASIFNAYILYNSKLIAIYTLSIFPLSMYLFIRSVKERRIYFLLVISIVWSAFSVLSIVSFWFFATLVTTIPIFLYELRKFKVRTLCYLLFFLGTLFMLNIHWLFFLPYTSLLSSSGGVAENSLKSLSFLKENIEGIRVTSEINHVFYPLLNLYHFKIQKNFQWPYLPIYESWYLKLIPLNLLFFLIILAPGYILKSKESLHKYLFYILSFFVSIYFFTVRLGKTRYGDVGIELFVFLSEKIPGFLVFRNMYDKFSHALSFNWTLLLGLSLIIISQRISKKHFRKILIVTVALIVLNAKPFMFNEFNKLPLWTTKNIYPAISHLDEDYYALTRFVSSQPYTGRYLFIPFGYGNVVPIKDSNLDNRYYVGVSPFLIFSGVNDYSGLISFGAYGDDLNQYIIDMDYEKTGEIFQKMNVSYIVLNTQINQEILDSYIYREHYLNTIDPGYIGPLLGNKIAVFGKYEIYQIASEYSKEKVYLEDGENARITYTKLDSHEYLVTLENFEEGKIVFSDPYFEEWRLRDNSGKYINVDNISDGPYKNIWSISKYELMDQLDSSYEINKDQTLNVTLHLYFSPFDYYYPTLYVSLGSYGVFFIFIILMFIKDRRAC